MLVFVIGIFRWDSFFLVRFSRFCVRASASSTDLLAFSSDCQSIIAFDFSMLLSSERFYYDCRNFVALLDCTKRS